MNNPPNRFNFNLFPFAHTNEIVSHWILWNKRQYEFIGRNKWKCKQLLRSTVFVCDLISLTLIAELRSNSNANDSIFRWLNLHSDEFLHTCRLSLWIRTNLDVRITTTTATINPTEINRTKSKKFIFMRLLEEPFWRIHTHICQIICFHRSHFWNLQNEKAECLRVCGASSLFLSFLSIGFYVTHLLLAFLFFLISCAKQNEKNVYVYNCTIKIIIIIIIIVVFVVSITSFIIVFSFILFEIFYCQLLS